MANSFLLTALLFHVLCIMVQGIIVFQQLTNCSDYFTYIPNTTHIIGKTKLLGRIKIPPPPVNEEYYLRVALNTTNEMKLKNSIGSRDFRLELARPIDESIRSIQQSKPLLYNVYYPSDKPTPTVSAIWFNNQQYCPGLESNGNNISATIELGHIVYPPSKEPGSWPWHRNSSNYRIDNPTRDRLTYLSHSSSTIANHFVEITNNDCGITNYYTDTTNRQYPNGQEPLPGQWPWVVAILAYRFKIKDYLFWCAGSILTVKHVITAGHCLKISGSNETTPANILVVVFGQTNLPLRGKGIVNREVASYTVHPDYDPFAASGDSDLAILTVKEPVEYTPFIKPICLFGSTNLQNVVNKRGYIMGWGQNVLSSFTGDPQMTKVSVVSQETCLRSDKRFFQLTSDRTFCAGGRNESGPCSGDSGSGLFIFDDTTGRYYLRGIVSRGIASINTYLCDHALYFVYVDVAKYISWIQQHISK